MPEKFYQNKIYPLQDEVLRGIQELNVDFYLTGGTALSRCYLNHRYSDDLDLFVNDNPKFKDQCKIIVSWFKQSQLKFEITTTSDSFIRGILEKDRIAMKIDFINDVPFHYGDFVTSQMQQES
jgi:predicted nucleotidyltransferase component of viral defense system